MVDNDSVLSEEGEGEESEDSNASDHVRRHKQERRLFHDNQEGPAFKYNKGYLVRPLDPKIFGIKRVIE